VSVFFYIAAVVGVVSTALALTRAHAIHALLYFVVSVFSTAFIFYLLGAPFAAALEVIIYAGAIMVLFVFVVMLLDLPPGIKGTEPSLRRPGVWAGPSILSLLLLAELLTVVIGPTPGFGTAVSPRQTGAALYSQYLIGVELASLLLLAGLVAAYHIARRGPVRKGGGE
jgi:NADH-quinone oxidoreductase subunit J